MGKMVLSMNGYKGGRSMFVIFEKWRATDKIFLKIRSHEISDKR